MLGELGAWAHDHRDALYALLDRWFADGRPLLLQSDLEKEFERLRGEYDKADLEATPLAAFVRHAQEGILRPPWATLAVRERVGHWHYVRIHLDRLEPETIGVAEFLRIKESLVAPDAPPDQLLEIDFGPFNRGFPRLREPRSIGQGVTFLNRQLSSALFDSRGEGHRRLLEFLSVHAIEGQSLMIRDGLSDVAALRTALRRALGRLEVLDEKTPWADLAESLSKLGFAPGWGDAAGSVAETMALLMDILEAPSPAALEAFLARIPMVSRILIVSPHGYFSQANVLGRPDTGGQVIYILDQVRALEREMRDRMHRQGVSVEPQILILTRLLPEAAGTTCHEPLEKVIGTSAATILRVPFRRENGEIVPHWISRFEVWPYLERFARDAEREVLARFGSRPDLVIGNYSDGILVATLLSQRLGVTQCNVAHALEMTKYLHSSLYWRENEPRYHFSCQYTADLIGMNAADFIITSTYQEIAGTATTVGQYESYGSFTMPGLYRVVNGVDLLDPKFNIVSPGVDEEVYFPYRERERRLTAQQPLLEAMIWGTEPLPFARGALEDRQRPLLFTMARLDRIKNIAGFVDWYGASERLRGLANLLVVGGSVDANQSADDEEREQIGRMHELMNRHRLDGQVRWIGKRLDRNLAGEVYRLVADGHGAFVQPALFEAFGLTVVEAMASGLPTFATRYGGPSEIIEPGRSGFRIDPNDGAASAAGIADFLEACRDDPQVWERISRGAIARVEARYTWRRYAERIMTLSRIYGFWKFVSNLEREETARYLQILYHLQFRPLAAALA